MLVECPYFALARFQARVPLPLPYAHEMSIWMVLAGEASLIGAGGYARPFRQGETVLIPATSAPLTWQPAADGEPVTLLAVRALQCGVSGCGGGRDFAAARSVTLAISRPPTSR